MEFRIADTFTDSLAKLTGEEQNPVNTTAFDLQIDVFNRRGITRRSRSMLNVFNRRRVRKGHICPAGCEIDDSGIDALNRGYCCFGTHDARGAAQAFDLKSDFV